MSTASEVIMLDNAASPERFRTLQLLVALVNLSKQVKHCWGPTEEELRKASGLKDQEFNEALCDLLNVKKCVQHRYSQEGTAGPFAHRYEVDKNLIYMVNRRE